MTDVRDSQTTGMDQVEYRHPFLYSLFLHGIKVSMSIHHSCQRMISK